MEYINTIIKNAKIYTIDNKNQIQEALVVKDEKIIYVGSNEGADKFINDKSKIIDAKNNILLPGFIDSHIHPPGTALTELYEVSLYGLNSIEEYKDAINEFISKNPNIKTVYGRGWSLGIFKGEELAKGPKKEHLDEISKDIPIILRAYDGHTIWLNSKAMKKFNININTTCPEGGKIEIDEENNELWGTLKESATHLIEEHKYTDEEYMKVASSVVSTWKGSIAAPYLMMQCSDSRHYGRISDKVYRFSAMDLTSEERSTIHGNNERIRLETVSKAVEFYIRLMKRC